MNHCIELDWPKLSDAQHQEILNFVDIHRHTARVVPFLADKDIEFLGIIDKPGMTELISKILRTTNIHIIKNTGVQQIRSKANKQNWKVEPHPDIRKIGALYTIEGPADSIWYTIDEPLRPNTSYQTEFEQGRLQQSGKCTMKLHTWYLYDHANIHSAVNCQGRRTSIALNLSWRFPNWGSAVAGKDTIEIFKE
jgi:hypothetical protein